MVFVGWGGEMNAPDEEVMMMWGGGSRAAIRNRMLPANRTTESRGPPAHTRGLARPKGALPVGMVDGGGVGEPSRRPQVDRLNSEHQGTPQQQALAFGR